MRIWEVRTFLEKRTSEKKKQDLRGGGSTVQVISTRRDKGWEPQKRSRTVPETRWTLSQIEEIRNECSKIWTSKVKSCSKEIIIFNSLS